jgi:5'-nucleotidase
LVGLKRKILITNDDGIYSSGIIASYQALKDMGEIYIVAPAVQRSGVGRSISLMEPVRVSEVVLNTEDRIRGYAVDGTPADSVLIAVHEIIGEVPDLVVSGINLGENVSTEAVLTSGTVGAAFEAATHGSMTVAISLEVSMKDKFADMFDFMNRAGEMDYSLCIDVLRNLAKILLERGFPVGVDVLNVNIPSKWNGKVAFTRLAKRLYLTRIDTRKDPRGRIYYWLDGDEVEDDEEGTDLHALRRGYISITPLSLDNTSKESLESVKRWFYEIC